MPYLTSSNRRKMALMKCRTFLALCIVLCQVHNASAWGTWGHNHINKGAIMALPAEMGMFFYNHADFIVEESTVPDLRKYTLGDRSENPRHYINLESYGYQNEQLPASIKEAIAKYGKDSVDRYGILPWYILDMKAKLTEAFRKKRKTEILFLAADLGHYIGDAHVPLHTTINHNGQLTGQQGIHSFWESQLPEIFGRTYKLNTREAKYIDNVSKSTWSLLDTSYSLLTNLLLNDRKMRKDKPEDLQFVLSKDGTPTLNKFGQKVHTYEFSHVYHELLNGMVEQQLKRAIRFTADIWYTAWVDAGRPDLSDLDSEATTEKNSPFYTADKAAWKKGKIRGCSSEKEYPTVGR
jgi:hypothetical protein